MNNLRLKEIANEVGLGVLHDGIVLTKPVNAVDALENFAQALIERVMTKIEAEIELAYEQGETWTASTLEALAIDILDDLDMELPDEND